MAYDITDYSEIEIYITDGWREWYIPKFRLTWTVDEPNIALYWTDTEKGTSGIRRTLTLDYNDVVFGYTSPSSAAEIASVLENYIISAFGGGGFVESVSAEANQPVKVDNTDPVNPVLNFEIETKTETADFTLALDDAWDVINLDTTGLLTVTVPTNASVAFPIGTSITFWGSDTGSVSFAPDTGVTINSLNGYLGLNGQFAKATLTKTGTNEWLIDGDLDVALDPDAHAYIDAVGTFTDAEKGYINTWFTSAKANGYYSKYHAVYLFLGGTAAAHKWNAIDPQDTNGAFRLVFTGSPTHNANGVTFNGTTQYANTFLQPSSVLGQNSKHYSCYLRTAGTGCHFGALNAGFAGDILMTSVGGTMYWCASVAFATDPPEGTRTQFWSVERSASTTSDVRRNDVSVDSDATASTVNVALDIVIGARNSNGTINVFSADNIAFFAIGDAFTSGEITSEYADVVALQTSFGRNV